MIRKIQSRKACIMKSESTPRFWLHLSLCLPRCVVCVCVYMHIHICVYILNIHVIILSVLSVPWFFHLTKGLRDYFNSVLLYLLHFLSGPLKICFPLFTSLYENRTLPLSSIMPDLHIHFKYSFLEVPTVRCLLTSLFGQVFLAKAKRLCR